MWLFVYFYTLVPKPSSWLHFCLKIASTNAIIQKCYKEHKVLKTFN